MNKLLDKQTSLRILMGVVILLLAMFILYATFKDTVFSAPELPETGGNFYESIDKDKFGLTIDTRFINKTSEGITLIPISLDGRTSEVVSSQIVFKFNPEDFEVLDVKEGDLFDFYVGKSIDNEKGYVYLTGAYTEIVDLDRATFAIFEVNMKKANATISLLGENDITEETTNVSKKITIYGLEQNLASKQFTF